MKNFVDMSDEEQALRMKQAPCIKCGAKTAEQAERICQPEDSHCPGCYIEEWD